MVTAAPTTCVNHRRRPRVATCGACGNGICVECIVHTGVGVKCRTCTGISAVKPGKAGRPKVDAAPKASAGRSTARKPWAVPVAIGGVIVLAAATFGLANRDPAPRVTEELPAATGATNAQAVERQTEIVGAGNQRIGATLTLPPLEGARTAPAVLIIPGLGALDRNGPVAANPPDALRDALVTTVTGVGVAVGDPLYRDLSELLAKEGIISLRYEKRGTTPSPLRSGQKLSFDDEVADARAALDLLAKRAEVGSAPIILLGQDVGSMVAMRLAAGNARVKGVVAVSTPARPIGEVLANDIARSRGPAVADAFRTASATLAATGTAPPADTLPEFVRPIFAPGHDAYLKSLFALDATAEVGKVAVPVLQVRGGGDPAVTAADADRLASSVRASGQVMVGDRAADRNLTLPGAEHVHSSSAAAPTIPRDVDTRVALVGWVKAQFTS